MKSGKILFLLIVLSLKSQGFEISISDNVEIKKFQSETNRRCFYLEILTFTIDGFQFEELDFDDPDSLLLMVANYSTASAREKERVSFSVQKDNKTYIYTPGQIFQERFLKCAYQGMSGFISRNGKRYSDCGMLGTYLKTGFNSFPASAPDGAVKREKIAGDYELDSFTTLQLLSGSEFIHEMIYLSNGIGFSKIGEGPVVFHTIESVVSFYKSLYDSDKRKKFSLYKVEYFE